MRRDLRLAKARGVLRCESALAVRRATEARLRGELAEEQRRRGELLQLAAQAAQAQAAELEGRGTRSLWLPSHVRQATAAVQARAAALLPRHAAAHAAQELHTSEARLRQLARSLRATQALAPAQEAELAAALAR